MKISDLKMEIREEILLLLSSTSYVHLAYTELQSIYGEIPSIFPQAKPVEINLIDSRRLTELGFYQLDWNISNEAIFIGQDRFSYYLWYETSGWCVDDESNDLGVISDRLVKTPFLDNMPLSVRDLHNLLKGGIWIFDKNSLPRFGGSCPKDNLEVLSWDIDNVLVGTNIQNIEVVSRKEWDEICAREQGWLN